MGVFPFSKLDNTNFLTTITGKNLKFMTGKSTAHKKGF